jgi:hypothetical protein
MFEREIQFIYDFNSNKVQKVGSYISLEQLRQVDIHPAILQYIVGEIDFLVFEDRQKLLKDSLFDYTIPSVAYYLKIIGEEVKKNKRFSINYIDKLIKHSSSFIVSYLCKPNWSLTKFVFEDENEKSAAEITQVLNYLFYYPHLKKVITAYFEKKKIKTVLASEFKELLEKINKAGLETNYPRIIDEGIDSISDFLNIGVFKKNLIPLKAVEFFLDDHNLTGHIEKLKEFYGDDPFQKCNASEIKEFLKKILIEKTEYLEEDEKESENTFEVVESPSPVKEKMDHDFDLKETSENFNENINDDNDTKEDTQTKTEYVDEPADELLPETSEEINLIQNAEENFDNTTDDSEFTFQESITEDETTNSDSESVQEEESDSVNDNSEAADEEAELRDDNELSLFENTEIEVDENKTKIVDEYKPLPEAEKKIDISEILNDKKMAKILDVVFDYDVEEFSNAVEKICRFQTQEEANLFIDAICEKAKLTPDSKESKTFKSVISKFYL